MRLPDRCTHKAETSSGERWDLTEAHTRPAKCRGVRRESLNGNTNSDLRPRKARAGQLVETPQGYAKAAVGNIPENREPFRSRGRKAAPTDSARCSESNKPQVKYSAVPLISSRWRRYRYRRPRWRPVRRWQRS